MSAILPRPYPYTAVSAKSIEMSSPYSAECCSEISLCLSLLRKIRGVIRKSRCTTGINNTGGKFSTGVNDTGGKFATGVNNTGSNFGC